MLVQMGNVKKMFGSKEALKDVTLEVGTGKIIGLLGINGSGKTTLMKIIAGLLQPTSGSISVLGKGIGVATKEIVSFMPDKPMVESWMTIEDTLQFHRDFFKDFNMEKAIKMLEFMKLDRKSKVTSLSKGMVEKLHLTLALSRDAKLYLLDEPIAAVDVVAREKILNTLIQFYNEDSTVN